MRADPFPVAGPDALRLAIPVACDVGDALGFGLGAARRFPIGIDAAAGRDLPADGAVGQCPAGSVATDDR